MNIAGGIVNGVMRFITGIIISTITFGIITEPMLPYWKARSSNSDSVYLAYLSLVYLHHFHNHPVFVTISKILIDG